MKPVVQRIDNETVNIIIPSSRSVDAVSVFFAKGNTPVSFLIRALCYRPSQVPWSCTPNHCGFRFSFVGGGECLHEALFVEGWSEKPANKLDLFAAKPGCKVWEFALPFDKDERQFLFDLSSAAVGRNIGYDWPDIIKLLVVERSIWFGRWFSVAESPRRWYCAEGVARIIHAVRRDWDLRDGRRTTFSSVTPASVMRRLRDVLISSDRNEAIMEKRYDG